MVSAPGAIAPGTAEPAVAAITDPDPVTPTPPPQTTSNVTDRLETFFYYWSANRQDDMLTLCAPSWQNKVENAKTALFGLMANRTPKDYAVESVSGTDYDTSRTVTVVSTMDRNNGKDPVRYRELVDTLLMLSELRAQYYPKYAVKSLDNKAIDVVNYLGSDYEAQYKYLTEILDNIKAVQNCAFSAEELRRIDEICGRA